MACSAEFIDFVCEVLAPLGEIYTRKMMGDYILYLDEKCVATLCDNNVYVKIHPSINELMKEAEIGKPYEGAKDHYILDLSNHALSRKVVSELWNHLQFPKKKGSSKKS
ncbi:MAG: TfoX/Sxy family protein [Muribaculaceae bacterium]|nr:TfoX/Sxy family protein [Muribaculaceae bacterium]